MRGIQRCFLLTSLSGLALLAACGDGVEPPDAGSSGADSGVHPDAVTPRPDATPVDSGELSDAGVMDATAPDAMVGRDATLPDSAEPRSIMFLHTNDEHSHELGFAPEIDDYPDRAQPGSGIVGGVKRRAALLDTLRAQAVSTGTPVAVVSSGDQMMGSFFHLANESRGIDYAVATLLGYDVMTLGNHELDFGTNALAGALSTGGIDMFGTPGIVQIPVVTTNIRFSIDSPNDDLLASLYSVAGDAEHPLRRTFIRRFSNVKVGFVGLLGQDAALVTPFKAPLHFSLATNTTTCASSAACPGSICLPPANDPTSTTGHCAVNADETDVATHFPAMVQDTAAAVAELRAQGCDLVVALSHVGVNDREINTLLAMGLPANAATASEEILLAKAVEQTLGQNGVRGLDLIIGGHSHTALMSPLVITYPGSSHATYVVQAGSYGRYVGQIRLTQADPGSDWTLDLAASHLNPVDDRTDVSGLSSIFLMSIDFAFNALINGLESNPAAVAGDDLIFPGEQCDGTTLPNRGLCAGLVPGATSGVISCFANRQVDASHCVIPQPSCGNSTVDGSENCDGADFAGASCASLGYSGGTLACHANCTYNTASCTPRFPSILEIILNFASGQPVQDDPTTTGDLFFARVGRTNFNIPDAPSSNESNLINLVTDSARAITNQLIPRMETDPIRIAINANGVIRDGIYQGQTGQISASDLFRVLPLGVSPVERTPGYTLVDFWLAPQEIVAGLELGVGQGATSDSFWLGVSGAQVDYDLARPVFDPLSPATTGRVMRVVLTSTEAPPHQDQVLEGTPLFDRSVGFPNPNRLVHVSTSLYIALLMEGFGICPRDATGVQSPACAACTGPAECAGVTGSVCDPNRHRCVAPVPAAVLSRTLMPTTFAELKEFLALLVYVRDYFDGPISAQYNGAVPRRMCCVGSACPADGSRSCRR